MECGMTRQLDGCRQVLCDLLSLKWHCFKFEAPCKKLRTPSTDKISVKLYVVWLHLNMCISIMSEVLHAVGLWLSRGVASQGSNIGTKLGFPPWLFAPVPVCGVCSYASGSLGLTRHKSKVRSLTDVMGFWGLHMTTTCRRQRISLMLCVLWQLL